MLKPRAIAAVVVAGGLLTILFGVPAHEASTREGVTRSGPLTLLSRSSYPLAPYTAPLGFETNSELSSPPTTSPLPQLNREARSEAEDASTVEPPSTTAEDAALSETPGSTAPASSATEQAGDGIVIATPSNLHAAPSTETPAPTATAIPAESPVASVTQPAATSTPTATPEAPTPPATPTASPTLATPTTAPVQSATPPPTQSPVPTATPVPATATPTSPPPATATATSPPPPSISLHAMEAALLESHNQQRANNGVSPLVIDARLVNVARQRSETMAAMNCFSHRACGPGAFDLMDGIGYAYGHAAENIAKNDYPDSDTVRVAMNGFMTSSGHRANVLKSAYTSVGIGVAVGANGMKYFTVVFAGP